MGALRRSRLVSAPTRPIRAQRVLHVPEQYIKRLIIHVVFPDDPGAVDEKEGRVDIDGPEVLLHLPADMTDGEVESVLPNVSVSLRVGHIQLQDAVGVGGDNREFRCAVPVLQLYQVRCDPGTGRATREP
jgi:hypothetical protein